MNNLHTLLDNHSVKQQNKIMQVTEPLNLRFGINAFGYRRVYNNNLSIMLTNIPTWTAYSIDHDYYRFDPTVVSPLRHRTGFSYMSVYPHKGFQENLVVDAINKFDLNHALTIIDRQPDYCDFFFFGAPTQHTHIYSIYHSNYHLLRDDFSQYFKAELADVIGQAHDDAVDLQQLIGEQYNNKHVLTLAGYEQQSVAFMQDINTFKMTAQLSSREQQCLDLYRKGKTAKETAQMLNLSPRTVEEYLNTVKKKMRCRYKRELLDQ